jgi:hypothetical protein
VKRLALFAKGNVDVHDSLHSCRIGGRLLWNGINDVLRAADMRVTVRLRHETWTRSDALLGACGAIPPDIASRDLPLGAYSAESQFSRAIFETPADAIVLSIQPDVMSGMMRHKAGDFLFYPSERASWTRADQDWLAREFEPVRALSVEASMRNFTALIEKIRAVSAAPILVYNLSPVIPGDHVHCYQGLDETLSTRIRKFNLALTALSEDTGISIIDVDTLVARGGADALKIDAAHLSGQGYALLAREVVRVLGDLGLLDEDEA